MKKMKTNMEFRKYLKSLILVFVISEGFCQCVGEATQPNNSDPDWVWYQTCENGLLMFYHNPDVSPAVNQVQQGVQTPFFTQGNVLSAENPSELDMYPEDGWILAYRNFGSSSSAPTWPFFVLYNKYRGLLRFMFFNAREYQHTHYKIELGFSDPNYSGAVFTLDDNQDPFLNSYNPDNKLSVVTKVDAGGVTGSWLVADFYAFGFDPIMDVDFANLTISITGADVSEVTIKGNINPNRIDLEDALNDSDIQAVSSNSFQTTTINDGLKIFKGGGKLIDDLEREVNGANGDEFWFDDVNTIVNSGLVSSLSILGKVAGFLETFIFSNDQTNKPVKISGSLDAIGETVLTQPLFTPELSLDLSAPPSPAYTSLLNDIQLGVFNLVEKPTIIWDYYFVKVPSTGQYIPDRYYDYFVWKLNSKLNYVFNHNAGVELVSINAAFSFENRSPTVYENPIVMEDHMFGGAFDFRAAYPPDNPPPLNINHAESSLPTGITLEIKLSTNSSLNNSDEIIVYKNFPIEHVLEYSIVNSNTSQPGIGIPMVPETIVLDEENDLDYEPFMDILLATKSIEAGDNFYIGNTISSADFMAGEEILLTPGFKVLSGSEFSAIVPQFQTLEDTRLDGNFESFRMDGVAYLDVNYYPKDEPEPDFRTLEVHYSEGDEVKDLDPEVESSISLFPNPAQQNVKLKMDLHSNEVLSVDFIDMDGKVQLSTKYSDLNIGDNEIDIDTSSLRGGMYLVRISGKSIKRIGRILIMD